MKFIVNRRFHLLIFALSFLVLTKFYIDGDLGWHIAIGRAFWEGRGIIRNDSFSWTMQGHFWGNSYFLYQIVVAWLFGHVGYLATIFVFGLMGAFSVLLLLPKKLNFVSVLVALLGAIIASINLGLRPHTFDLLFFALLLVLINKKQHLKKHWAPFWFVFFALWANFHFGFLIGLLTFTGFIVINFLETRTVNGKSSLKFSLLMLSGAWIGTLVTPFGISMWKSIIFDSTSPLAWVYVVEFQPITVSLALTVFYILSALVFLQILRSKHKHIEVAWFLLAAFLFILPLVSYTYTPFWAEALIFLGTRHFAPDPDFLKKFSARLPIYLTFAAVVFSMCLVFAGRFIASGSLQKGFNANNYPVNAMNFIEALNYKDHLYNNYNWGGFIDWQYPDAKVFIDGRMTGWKKEDGSYIFGEYIQIERGSCDPVKNYDIKIALVPKESSARCFSSWNTVYSDQVAKVLVRPN